MLDELKRQFQDPGADYSVMPFWFLNGELDENGILEKLRDFKSKGVDGFVLHPRIGLPDELDYLGNRFMELVEYTVREAKSLDMKVVLYDEGMYPSGSANGLVVKSNPAYAARAMRMEIKSSVSENVLLNAGEEIIRVFTARLLDKNKLDFESVRQITPDAVTTDGLAVIYLISTFSKGTIRGIHFGEDDGEKNAPPASDILNEETVQAFIKITHDTYYSVLEKYFGSTVIGVFTDEPDVMGRTVNKAKMKPWTKGFLDFYVGLGNKPADMLALWFDIGEKTAEKRKLFEIAVAKKLELSYYKQLSEWCEAHGVALAGHPAESEDIGLLRYFQIPGQDVVWRYIGPEDNKGIEGHHSTMGKCSSDAARHFGRRRNGNECFGCCSPNGELWSLPAGDMKWYMDWLFIRGVNLLYPHAFYYSVEGELRLNERPPDVGPNNLWWKHYGIIAAYAKRMSYIMTDSVNSTEIAVLCEENHLPWRIAKPLQQNQMEFNYLEKNLLCSECEIADGKLTLLKQAYSVVLVEDPHSVSEGAAKKLNAFIQSGGHVIIYNPSGKLSNIPGATAIADFDELAKVLAKLSKPEIIFHHPDLRVSHIIKNGIDFYAFVNEGEEQISGEAVILNTGYFEMWDPLTGETSAIAPTRIIDGYNHFNMELERRQALIVCVDKNGASIKDAPRRNLVTTNVSLENPWTLELPMGGQKEIKLLESWTNFKEMEHYSGEAVYQTTLDLSGLPSFKKLVIDFGNVGELTQLFVDDKEAGVRLWAPYAFDITSFAAKNSIRLKLIVTNSIANRLTGASKPSGLLGPVKIKLGQ